MSIDQSKRINLWLEIRYEDKIYFSESVANGDIGDLLPVDCYGCRLWCPHVGTGGGCVDRAYQGPCYYIDRR